MYFNYYTYYNNNNIENETEKNEYKTYTDKQLKKEIFKLNKKFNKTETFKRFF